MLCVRKATSDKSDLYVGLWILQEFEVFHSAGGLAELQFDMRTRKYFAILTSVIFERSTLKGRRHDDLRRRRGNKISQGQRANGHNPTSHRQRLDYLPT